MLRHCMEVTGCVGADSAGFSSCYRKLDYPKVHYSFCSSQGSDPSVSPQISDTYPTLVHDSYNYSDCWMTQSDDSLANKLVELYLNE